jgi:aminopeptidase N
MKKIFSLLLTSLSIAAFAQPIVNSYLKDNTTYREHPLDITYMKLDVSFKESEGKVIGKVAHSFTVLQQKVDSVFFDGPGIKISKSTLNGQDLKFKTVSTGIWVFPSKSLKWDETGTISFEYEASPRKGIYFIGWNEEAPKESNPFAVRKQIWTQGQGIDNRQWIPMYDDMNDKFITETSITFNKEYQVLSNGLLVKKNANGNNITWNYKMTKPHAGYLLMIAIGKYAVQTAKSKSGVPLQYWYYPEFADRMEPTYRYTPQMIDFLERETGIKYPWESYSQVMVQDFIFGAMENTTATIFGDFFNVDARAFLDRNYIGVNCHEMTHQWFGDYITARDGRDTWLQESYATYWPKQFSKELDGVEEWDWQRRGHQNSAVDAGKKDNYPVHHTSGGTARVYPKGAAVISMLEYVLGDEQWKRALNHYLKQHAYGNVETNDLQQAIKDKLGLNLDWFFDQWIMRGGEPHYKVQYQDVTYGNGSRATEVMVEQIQKTDETVHHFQMPLVVEVHYADGSFDSVKEMNKEAYESIKIPNPNKKQIAYVLFDPNSNIIKQVTFKKSFEELEEQIEKAKYYLDRYDAAVALREIPLDTKREVLLEALNREKHYGIINEIVSQLISDKDLKSQVAMMNLMNIKQKSSTREAVLKGLTDMNKQWKQICMIALSDSSYDVVKVSMEKLYQKSFDKKTMEYLLEATKNTWGMNNNIMIKRHEIGALAGLLIDKSFDREEALNKITNFASSQYEFRTRIQAFNSLKVLNHLDNEVAKNLFQAILSPNGRLASPSAELANHFSNQISYKNTMKDYYQKQNFEQWQKDILTKQLTWLN